ncbi:hypothetical protein HDU96_006815 [Phlyctochytrium bullatum]|nr:hypothetical protein HDU96_006815 [Phlyctochytrium bullatum]
MQASPPFHSELLNQDPILNTPAVAEVTLDDVGNEAVRESKATYLGREFGHGITRAEIGRASLRKRDAIALAAGPDPWVQHVRNELDDANERTETLENIFAEFRGLQRQGLTNVANQVENLGGRMNALFERMEARMDRQSAEQAGQTDLLRGHMEEAIGRLSNEVALLRVEQQNLATRIGGFEIRFERLFFAHVENSKIRHENHVAFQTQPGVPRALHPLNKVNRGFFQLPPHMLVNLPQVLQGEPPEPGPGVIPPAELRFPLTTEAVDLTSAEIVHLACWYNDSFGIDFLAIEPVDVVRRKFWRFLRGRN